MNGFTFAIHIASGNKKAVADHLNDYDPYGIIGMIGFTYNKVRLVKRLIDLNKQDWEICKIAKVSQRDIGLMKTLAQRYSQEYLDKCTVWISETELNLKRSVGRPREQLNSLIFRLMLNA